MSQATHSNMPWRVTVLMGLLLASSSAAMAQWQWIDGTGRKVFSDTPPPANIPDKSIVRKPGSGMAPPVAVTEPSAPSAGASAAASSSAAPQVPARDNELEAKKKQAEEAEEAKKKAETERVAKVRADNCQRARKAKITMDSGVRLATTNAKGEREIMDDKSKAAESQRMDAIIRSDCGPLPKQ